MHSGAIRFLLFTAVLLGAAGLQPAFLCASGSGNGLYFSVRLHGFSIHPNKQPFLAKDYPYSIGENGRMVFTPGVQMALDQPLPWRSVTHLRYVLNFNLDCALQPSGFGGIVFLFRSLETDWFAFQGGLGAGIYLRNGWKYHNVIPGHRSPVFGRGRPVEWMISPYPEIEIRFRRPGGRVEFTVDFMSVVIISLLNAGVRFRLD